MMFDPPVNLSLSATLDDFKAAVHKQVEHFGKQMLQLKSGQYNEARVRQDFIDPFFTALGWDLQNLAGRIQSHREVEIESATIVDSRKKRADYLFRAHGKDSFICEAKKPAEILNEKYAFQAKRYSFNKGLPLAILTDFEEIVVYIVLGKPQVTDAVEYGRYKVWRYDQFVAQAQDIWDLLSKEAVHSGSIERLIDSLPKRTTGKGRSKNLLLFKPDRSQSVDHAFLNVLDEARRSLASDLLRQNEREELLHDHLLNDVVQSILDRLLFLRICEDRDIDTGRTLALIERNCDLKHSLLWRDIVAHMQALDQRKPNPLPYFNGNIFKQHPCETLIISNEWLLSFLKAIGNESVYLFNYISVEILGTIYERFLGKVVRPQGRGVSIEEKPEVRKAGGVYYTPRYIVDYIVEQTLGELVQGKTPEETLSLRILDPACGSGSFLIRAYERMCEHWLQHFVENLPKAGAAREKWLIKNQAYCWIDVAGDLHLSTHLKRKILIENIYGVDVDHAAVEVTQLSLYLKMIEGEDRQSIQRQNELFDKIPALLPKLDQNIKCGNSLIASDFSMIADELVRVNAFDWEVQFAKIMKSGGFDAVIGNPPYGRLLDRNGEIYIAEKIPGFLTMPDVYVAFIIHGFNLIKKSGRLSYIVPSAWLGGPAYLSMRQLLLSYSIEKVVSLPFDVFADAYIDTAILVVNNSPPKNTHKVKCYAYNKKAKIETISIKGSAYSKVSYSLWKNAADNKFVLSVGIAKIAQRLQKNCITSLNDYIEMKRGVLFNTELLSSRKVNKDDYPYFEGSVYRYEIINKTQNWIEYGNKMREWPKDFKWFEGRRLLMRRLVNRQKRLMTCFAENTFISNKNLYSILIKKEVLGENTEAYILGILNSKLISTLYLGQIQQATKDDFPQVTIKDILSLPCPKPDEKIKKSIITLASKLLDLMVSAKHAREKEKHILQNAINATDQKIDQLVYALYALTPEEIAIVEGGY